ncbi:MAG: polyphosphate polymerase domain-containing protein [Clostridia bacterium]|nr:polyphosphate polymerase domain-containing protein [Clostridia bacterium]
MISNNVFERYEIKYLLTNSQKRSVMNAMEKYMKPDEYGKSTICNVYYDTPDYYLIRHSLEKPVYKEKLRVRSYGTAASRDNVFVELKKKYQDVVYKRRITLPEREAMFYLGSDAYGGLDGQIGSEIDYFRFFYRELAPKVFISYDREAFYDREDDSFRVTFDENILWRDRDLSLTKGPYGKKILPPDTSLMEVKTSGGIPLWMTSVMSENGIFKTTFSKYGRAYNALAKNRE